MNQTTRHRFDFEPNDAKNLENYLGNVMSYQEILRDQAAHVAARTWRSFNTNPNQRFSSIETLSKEGDAPY